MAATTDIWMLNLFHTQTLISHTWQMQIDFTKLIHQKKFKLATKGRYIYLDLKFNINTPLG